MKTAARNKRQSINCFDRQHPLQTATQRQCHILLYWQLLAVTVTSVHFS
jgi:hypothetical protein